MAETSKTASPADALTGFWQNFFEKMGGDGVALPANAFSNEAAKQMQRVFFDAMAKYCDDFMRSDQFLAMMKQTMDRSLAFKQQMDQFLGQLQKGVQAPARGDLDDIAGTLRGIEQRVLNRIESLEKKVAAQESGAGRRAEHRPPAGAKRTPRAAARRIKRKK